MSTLFIVFMIGVIVFRLAKPIATQFMTERDYLLRRNVWLTLVAVAGISPNFWLYAAVAVPALTRAARKDSNPVALYLLLLHVIPPVPIEIPVPGINALFPLDNYRLLSFCILVPTAVKIARGNPPNRLRTLTAIDWSLLGFGLLKTALYVRPDLPSHIILPDSPTNALRRGALFFLDVYVLYFVVSRTCSNRLLITEAMATYVLASAVMACVSIFEFSRHWLLYVNLAVRWSGDPMLGFYLIRGDTLRAQASAGHALALGHLLAIAFGFWLYLQSNLRKNRQRIGGAAVIWSGLLGAYSRGPWIGAVVTYFAFTAMGPRAIPRLIKSAVIVATLGSLILLSPVGHKIVSVIPFLGGTVDSGSTEYRTRLAHRSWELIKESPLFGNQIAFTRMEDLRQGQGIIDLVDTYAEIALSYGMCGLALFLGSMLMAFKRMLKRLKETKSSDPDLALLGASIGACIFGTLLMIASNSFGLGPEKMYYVLVGLASAYSQLPVSLTPSAQTDS